LVAGTNKFSKRWQGWSKSCFWTGAEKYLFDYQPRLFFNWPLSGNI